MRQRIWFICLVIAIAVIVTGIAAAPVPAGNRSGDNSGEVVFPVTHETQKPVVQETERTPAATPSPEHTPPPTTPRQTSPPPTTVRATPPPTMPSQTVTQTPTLSSTTPQVTTPTFSATPPTPTPARPFTTIPTAYGGGNYQGYRYGRGYSPVYYYPPGYPYSISSYYPDGSLVVTSSPSNAIVILDGYSRENTPFVFTNLVPGYHSIEIDYPGYEAYMTSVYIDSGSTSEIDANLASLASYGSLFIDSTPEGADVYVDGNFEGTTAMTVSALTAGPHQVELHLAGYEVLTRTFDISAGQGTTLYLALSPYGASSDTGSISISANIPGALVYLDGIYKGSVPSGSVFSVIAVSPGTHTILLHAPGYTDFTQTIQVNAGQITSVAATFTQGGQPAAPVSEQGGGTILASSSPAGAQVWVDNQFRGVAPVTIYNVDPGSHIVNMRLAGFSDYSTSVQVQAGQVVQVPATLTPGSGAIPTQAALPAELVPAGLCVAIVILVLGRR